MEKREAGKIQRKSDKTVKEESDKKNSAEWQREEEYLHQTLDIVKRNVENYESEIREMSEQIEEMLQHYHDNDVEVYTQMSNTVTMRDHMQFALMRNRKAIKKPYFGRIDFLDETLQKEEALYIGRGGIAKDTTHQMVVDWRAPVANAYYENGLGECSYCAPDFLYSLQLCRALPAGGLLYCRKQPDFAGIYYRGSAGSGRVWHPADDDGTAFCEAPV